MNCSRSVLLVTGLSMVIITAVIWAAPARSLLHAADAAQEDGLSPVEPDVHEFMEYVFEPAYGRLKSAMDKEPDKQNWKTIKSGSLTLAEGANLLLIRKPDKNPQDWVRHATDVRTAGSEFYQAAKSKDFQAAKLGFEQMLKSCNACHNQFADGKPNLKP